MCSASDDSGQATVEAAFALPVLMLLVLLLLQPGIILYDTIVMKAAASDACRLLSTSSSDASSVNDDYVRRRLSAVPQIDCFHVHSGGCSWHIEMTGDESSESVSVRISTEVKPLPLLDSAMVLSGMANSSGNIVVSVESHAQTQPEWVEHATEGGDPANWVSA